MICIIIISTQRPYSVTDNDMGDNYKREQSSRWNQSYVSIAAEVDVKYKYLYKCNVHIYLHIQ